MRCAYLVLLAPLAVTGCDNPTAVTSTNDPAQAAIVAEESPRQQPGAKNFVAMHHVSAQVAPDGSAEGTIERINRDDLARVMAQAEAYARGVLESDPERVVDLVYPALAELLGGRDEVFREMAAELVSLQEQGTAIDSFQIAEPAQVHLGESYRATFVPAKIRYRTAGAELEKCTFLLAIARLDGDEWYVMDGTKLTREEFRHFFSGFRTTLELPPVTQRSL